MSMIEYEAGDIVQHGEAKAIVLAPAFHEGFWQVANIFDDNGEFAVVDAREMRPAVLDKDEAFFGDLIAEQLLAA
jgi:hypothetical protein